MSLQEVQAWKLATDGIDVLGSLNTEGTEARVHQGHQGHALRHREHRSTKGSEHRGRIGALKHQGTEHFSTEGAEHQGHMHQGHQGHRSTKGTEAPRHQGTGQVLCAVIAGLLHYLFMASFAWMCLEGVQLFLLVRKLREVGQSKTQALRRSSLLLAGYGLPAVIVAMSAGVFPDGYGDKEICWLKNEQDFRWSFHGPIYFIIAVNIFLFIAILWTLKATLSVLNADVSKLKDTRLLVFKSLAQFLIMGCSWVLGFTVQDPTFRLLFVILNSQQGSFIFIVHCLLNREHTWPFRPPPLLVPKVPASSPSPGTGQQRAKDGGHGGMSSSHPNSRSIPVDRAQASSSGQGNFGGGLQTSPPFFMAGSSPPRGSGHPFSCSEIAAVSRPPTLIEAEPAGIHPLLVEVGAASSPPMAVETEAAPTALLLAVEAVARAPLPLVLEMSALGPLPLALEMAAVAPLPLALGTMVRAPLPLALEMAAMAPLPLALGTMVRAPLPLVLEMAAMAPLPLMLEMAAAGLFPMELETAGALPYLQPGSTSQPQIPSEESEFVARPLPLTPDAQAPPSPAMRGSG
ncbi:UNVERIFIED_CONTAM: hypothetical protein FKN15_019431 [Acipenser sinensis]